MSVLELDPDEIPEAKGRSVREQFRLVEVSLDDAPLFERAYAMLDTEFGPRGELERREVVTGWLRAKRPSAFEGYHLLAAEEAAASGNELAAVRDCHVRLDREARAAVAYLAHVVVAPPYRRSGLAALLRAAPSALARRALGVAHVDGDVLLAAEMEPAEVGARDTLLRLIAYGKAGFAAIAPECLPYCQPDFRDPTRTGFRARPLPFLAIVRTTASGPRIPKRLARAFVTNLYEVFATHCRAEDLELPRAHALGVLEAYPEPDVPLLPLPISEDDTEALRPLLRENVVSYHLPEIVQAS